MALARATILDCVGPMNCPPTSMKVPSRWTVQVRPPTRSRASRTATEAPLLTRRRAAARPDRPAPTMTTSTLRAPDALERAGHATEGTAAPAAAAADEPTNLRR